MSLIALIKSYFTPDPPEIREIKQALKTASRFRGSQDRVSVVIYDYPILVDLAKAYIQAQDWDSAQQVIRTCFNLRDEYAQWGANRDAFLVKRLVKEFIKNGREDIAQHIMKKSLNFEMGVPTHQLSTTFFPDQDALRRALEDYKE